MITNNWLSHLSRHVTFVCWKLAAEKVFSVSQDNLSRQKKKKTPATNNIAETTGTGPELVDDVYTRLVVVVGTVWCCCFAAGAGDGMSR